MLVQVQATHIKKGQSRDSARCPIALALRDMGYQYVNVSDHSVYVHKTVETGSEQPGRQYTLPEEAKVFIERFDDKSEVKPFSFIMTRV